MVAARSRLLSVAVLLAAGAFVATTFVPPPAAAPRAPPSDLAPAQHAALLGVAAAAVPTAAHAAKAFDPVDVIFRLVALVAVLLGPIIAFLGLQFILPQADMSK
ncbi:unnamed protein product [Prorocentrum cordatum]|uniref:Uncharacterized protein n=1 Tax=Prorocentrum cordatum TaxID=2364126 RepID=A0ABN9SER9_9DINO|nr:unnamed protein product [Polarella glacialis]